MEAIPEFGERSPARTYRDRPAGYAVIFDEMGRMAACRVSGKGHHLLGGATDPGETHDQALRREIREEIGYVATVGEKIGVAAQCMDIAGEGAIRKVGHFFLAQLGEAVGPGEDDHELVWLERTRLPDAIKDEYQRWAVARALELEP